METEIKKKQIRVRERKEKVQLEQNLVFQLQREKRMVKSLTNKLFELNKELKREKEEHQNLLRQLIRQADDILAGPTTLLPPTSYASLRL